MEPISPDTPQAVRERAVGLVDYLLAVRALLEKPTSAVPTADAWWQGDLPVHPALSIGPTGPGEDWLRIGRPAQPADLVIPPAFTARLIWDLSDLEIPRLAQLAPPAAGATPSASETTVVVTPIDPVAVQFDDWVAQVWQPWARESIAARATRTLHDKLYDLRHRLDLDVARLELVWGHLILVAKADGSSIRYPLIATSVAIEYDAATTTVTVSPQGPPRLQSDALNDLDNRRVADLLDFGGTGGQVDVDPWDEAERLDFAQQAMRRLGFDPLVVTAGAAKAPAAPHVRDAGVLFVRPRQRMVRRFLEEMRAADHSPGALSTILAHEPSKLTLPDDDAPEQWTPLAERLLMPLPTNEAQESIARRLAVHRNVAVQGPPGTGKTHTIRNLICHLVAHGKRVLVLAQKEDPLRVLRDGLPEELQPLCLAILGRSSDQLVQLQIAARELSDRAATLDQAAQDRLAARLVADITRAEAELSAAQTQLLLAAEREAASLDGRGASEIGEWLRANALTLGVVPDPIGVDVPPPLSTVEFGVLVEIARRVSATDRAAALGALPVDGQLPTGDQLAARRDAARDAEKVVDALLDRGISLDGVRQLGEQGAAELARQLRTAADDLARREGTWTDRLGQLVRDPGWQGVWDAHVAACQQLLSDLGRRTTLLSGRAIVVPPDAIAQPRQLLGQLTEARDRLAEGKRIGRLTNGDLHELMNECRIDGEPLRTQADVELVMALVERGQLRQELATRWAEWAQRLGAPPPDREAGEPEIWAGRWLQQAIDALDWDRRRWPALFQTITRVYPRCERSVDARMLGELAGVVEACGTVLVADRHAAQRQALAGWIDQVAGDPASSPALRDLAEAWRADDLGDWDVCLAEIRRLWTVRPDALRFNEFANRLLTVAPQWTAMLAAGNAVPADGETCAQAWRWRQAQTWFDETVGAIDTAGLGRRVERCRDQIRRLTGDLVITSAWLAVARTLDDRKKAALADWTAALRKIGKGTGKSAAHWQGVAQRAMTQAVSAVPVWVMSVDRALEQFKGGEQIFDVVIVDEASQADIFSLPVLSLAKRAVVVGDDQQIGPQLVGVPTDRVQGLISAHLDGVPSAEHFDTESSLYDHAVRRSQERILLTEHFRCVPAIISFSSEHYYDGKIQPLRADAPAGIGAAVNAVFVPGGLREQHPEYGEVNVPEAEALVSRFVHIVGDPAYAGKTIGVVSLLSTSGQAEYLLQRLREEVGPEELAVRDVRVGDAYTFQGDERDIVLISMVVAGSGFGAFVKRDFHRRVNVAASRGRDQLWIFHSVPPSQFAADDARGLLLAHAARPRVVAPATEKLAELCENDFQRAVLRRLQGKGLHPVPQYRIGAFRIDFVLTAADGRRLAIECDGDRFDGPEAFAADLRRQAILERVGNASFVRLRSSVFHRDPDVALAPVWQRVEELAITPN